MTKEEALKMALEALQFALHVGFDESSERQIRKGAKARQQHRQAITAIKEALAQPVQEPVAWLSTDSIGERYLCFDKPLDKDLMKPLYTTPPQRTWVGLTEVDILAASRHWRHAEDFMAGVYWAAGTLKEKNT